MRFILSLLLTCAFIGSAHSADEPIQVLGIGNSFTGNSFKYLAQISEASTGKNIQFKGALKGGCSLETHARMLKEHEADPKTGLAYGHKYTDPETGEVKSEKKGLKYFLTLKKWDVITIQQVSKFSTLEETYQPHANELVAYIKKHAPDAKILIHQTWAYRVDGDFDIVWPKKPGYNQEAMYRDSATAYGKLSKSFGFDLIPVGTAFQVARERKPFVPVEFDQTSGKIPAQPNSLCSGWYKRKGKLRNDSHHANKRGCFLAGLVWFGTITGEDPAALDLSKLTDITEDDRAFFQQVAHDVVVKGVRPAIQPKLD